MARGDREVLVSRAEFDSKADSDPADFERTTWDDARFDQSVYEWRALDEQAICAFPPAAGRRRWDRKRLAMARPQLPERARARIEKNLERCVAPPPSAAPG